MSAVGLVLWLAAGLAAAPVPAPANAAAAPVVFAWFPKSADGWTTKAIQWDALTHLCFRSVILKADGSLDEPVDRAEVKALVDEAHGHGVKVCVLVAGTDAAGSAAYLGGHAKDAAVALARYVKENQLDGVNVADETWTETNAVTKGPNRDLVTAFFQALRGALNAVRPGLELSWASPPIIVTWESGGIGWPDYAAIAKLVDHFTIRAYETAPPLVGWTGCAEPVGGGGKVQEHGRDLATVIDDYLMNTEYDGAKLLLGIATTRDGVEWTAKGPEPLALTTSVPHPLAAAEAEARAATYGRRWEPLQRAPWYRHQEGDHWVQGWWQDDQAFMDRLIYARDRPLGGVCLWVLDGAAEPPATFALLRQVLRHPPKP